MSNRKPSANADQPVAIIGGTGALGFGLTLRLAADGVPLVIGSRDAGRALEAAADVRRQVIDANKGTPDIRGLQNAEAVEMCSTIFLTVPFKAQYETLKNIRPSLSEGSLLIDTTVPLETAVGGKSTRPLGVWRGSAAQQAQAMVPGGVAVVATLHTVSAKSLSDLDNELDEDALICGDEAESKVAVAELLLRIPGLRPVDCGPLELARITEQLTPLLIAVNKQYGTEHSGLKITQLPEVR